MNGKKKLRSGWYRNSFPSIGYTPNEFMIFKSTHTKIFLMMCLLFYSRSSIAQASNPLTSIDTFFEGFYLRDSLLIQSEVTVDTELFRAGNSEEKIPFREAISMKKFIRMVTSRPEKLIWEELQVEPVVYQDQNLAVVWMPFRFYLDQKVLHCGYNLFTLFWNGNTWLITQVSDTGTMNCTVNN